MTALIDKVNAWGKLTFGISHVLIALLAALAVTHLIPQSDTLLGILIALANSCSAAGYATGHIGDRSS